jgi:hypothetical protein
MKRLALILALGLVLAGCAGDSQSAETTAGSEGVDFAGAPTETTSAAAAETTTPGGEEAPGDLPITQRQVIRAASLELEDEDTRGTFEEIVALVEGVGGFVSSATVHPVSDEDDQPEVTMTLRIPSGDLSSVMATIKESVDEVVTESQDAQDVTDQFVDLEARLTNLQALEVELVALLTEVREQPDADPAKLLTVFNEVARVRGEIEQLQGQLNYLEDVVSLATLDVHLAPTPEAVPIVEEEWAPLEVARESLRNLVAGLQDFADWAINFAIYTLPLLILTLGIPILIGFLVYRGWRKRNPRPEAGISPEPAPSAPAAGGEG